MNKIFSLLLLLYHMSNKVYDEITYPFPNFNSFPMEVWEWIRYFTPSFLMDVMTKQCLQNGPMEATVRTHHN